MGDVTTWELLSYVVTVFGLPLAIFLFIYEERKERNNEEEEVYQLLSDAYTDFLKLVPRRKMPPTPRSGHDGRPGLQTEEGTCR